jgi:serine/threonine protein phosphatase 1
MASRNDVPPRGLDRFFAWLLPDADESHVYPAAPSGTVIYAIGDIHGRLDLLEAIGARIDRDAEREQPNESIEIYLGDYIDRGPSSAAVFDWLIKRQDNRSTFFLRGNHEFLLEEFLAQETAYKDWGQLGGFETLVSYGIDHLLPHDLPEDSYIRDELASRIPSEHRRFLDELLTSVEIGPYLFVHAGVRPGIALEEQNERDCLWIRDEFLEHEGKFERLVVHGHSPVAKPELLPNRINIDTGAFATGRLSCLKISARGARLLESGDG